MGAYREMYEPLQRAIEGFNQQLNVNRSAADRRMMISRQLRMDEAAREQQTFQNKMSERRMKLTEQQAKAADDHRAWEKAQTQREWAAGSKKRELEKILANRDLNFYKTPTEVNLFDGFDNNDRIQKFVIENPDARADLNDIYRSVLGKGASMDDDGTVYVNGQQAKLTPIQRNQIRHKLGTVVQHYNDPFKAALHERQMALQQIATKEAALKELGDDPRKSGARGRLASEIATAKATVDKVESLTGEDLTEAYRQRVEFFQKRQAAALAYRDEAGYTAATAAMAEASKQLNQHQQYTYAATAARLKAKTGTDMKKTPWTSELRSLREHFGKYNEEGQFFVTEGLERELQIAEELFGMMVEGEPDKVKSVRYINMARQVANDLPEIMERKVTERLAMPKYANYTPEEKTKTANQIRTKVKEIVFRNTLASLKQR